MAICGTLHAWWARHSIGHAPGTEPDATACPDYALIDLTAQMQRVLQPRHHGHRTCRNPYSVENKINEFRRQACDQWSPGKLRVSRRADDVRGRSG